MVMLVLMVACSPETTPTSSPPPSTATTSADTTTPPPLAEPTTTTEPPSRFLASTEVYRDDLEVAVHAPPKMGSWPTVLLLHGGGWVAGERAMMTPLAEGLAERGVVAFNASYRTVSLGGRFPDMVDDVACALSYAAAAAGRFTTAAGVWVVGYSAGAHLGALVTVAPDRFGSECPSVSPVGFVGLAGPYNIDRIELALLPFFGVPRNEDPELWARGNPLFYVETAPYVPYRLVYGDSDRLVPPVFSEEFARALTGAGRDARTVMVPGADHSTIADPEVVADLIVGLLKG